MAEVINNPLGFALTYDDVVQVPRRADFAPWDTHISSNLTKTIKLYTPISSSPMPDVSSLEAVAMMAKMGGMGWIDRNDAERQIRTITDLKKEEGYIVMDPVTIPNAIPELQNEQNVRASTVADFRLLSSESGYSNFPVIDYKTNDFLGIITEGDCRFADDSEPITERMTSAENSIIVKKGINRENAMKALDRGRKKSVVVLDGSSVYGIITATDVIKRELHPYATRDTEGRLMVGAAISPEPEEMPHIGKLVRAGVDALVIDVAHGHSGHMEDAVRRIKDDYPDLPVIAGNVVTSEAVENLASAGADAVRIGVGAGSICTTRIVAGSGRAQLQAVMECSEEARKHGIYSMADGGIKQYGDLLKALSFADTVMMGGMFAGSAEAPGEVETLAGKPVKTYSGQASQKSIDNRNQSSAVRYHINDDFDREVMIPQGVDGVVPYTGPLAFTLAQMRGAIRVGMHYGGAKDLEELREKAQFEVVSPNAMREGHPSVILIKDPINYKVPRQVA